MSTSRDPRNVDWFTREFGVQASEITADPGIFNVILNVDRYIGVQRSA